MRTLGDRWAKQCGNKIRYSDPQSAWEIALTMRRLEKDEFNAYLCDCCGYWHVGHRRPRLRARNKAIKSQSVWTVPGGLPFTNRRH